MGRRVPIEIQPVVDEFGQAFGLDVIQGIGESHFAELVVVAVGFAVRCDVHQFRPGAGLLGKSSEQPFGKLLAVVQNSLEGYGARNRSVVEENIEGLPRGQPTP